MEELPSEEPKQPDWTKHGFKDEGEFKTFVDEMRNLKTEHEKLRSSIEKPEDPFYSIEGKTQDELKALEDRLVSFSRNPRDFIAKSMGREIIELVQQIVNQRLSEESANSALSSSSEYFDSNPQAKVLYDRLVKSGISKKEAYDTAREVFPNKATTDSRASDRKGGAPGKGSGREAPARKPSVKGDLLEESINAELDKMFNGE